MASVCSRRRRLGGAEATPAPIPSCCGRADHAGISDPSCLARQRHASAHKVRYSSIGLFGSAPMAWLRRHAIWLLCLTALKKPAATCTSIGQFVRKMIAWPRPAGMPVNRTKDDDAARLKPANIAVSRGAELGDTSRGCQHGLPFLPAAAERRFSGQSADQTKEAPRAMPLVQIESSLVCVGARTTGGPASPAFFPACAQLPNTSGQLVGSAA